MGIDGISGFAGGIINRQMTQTHLQLLEGFQHLSTGSSSGDLSDSGMVLSKATRLEAERRATAMAETNIQVGINMVRSADSSLDSITEDIQGIRELSIQASTGALTPSARSAIQDNINTLIEGISDTISSAEFNSKNLFSGQTAVFQVGPGPSNTLTLELPVISVESLGLDTIDVTTQAGSEAAITAASGALDGVMEISAGFGATESRFESALDTLPQAWLSGEGSSSGSDADSAMEHLNANRAMDTLQAQMMVTAQTMQLDRDFVAKLLG